VKVSFRYLVPALAVAAAWLAIPALAAAHARVSPAVSLSGELALYSRAVPTEKSGVTTTRIVFTVPSGFGIDSFAPPPPGWHQQLQQTGSGENAVITRVTWSGGHTPTGEDSVFQFLAQPANNGTYTFGVQQTYSDGSIVNWNGPDSAEAPAPTIEAVSSLGGGGSSLLSIIALVLGALGLLAGGFALVSRQGRDLV
jgi:periplasmic copper chaperone A